MKFKNTMREMNCTKCGVCIGKSVHYLNNQVFWCFKCAEKTEEMWRNKE